MICRKANCKTITMKKIFLFVIACAASIFTRAQNDVIVDPNAEVRTLNASFTAIKVWGGID